MAKSTSTTSTPRARKPKGAEQAAIKANLEQSKDDHTITDEQKAADKAADEHVKNDVMSQFVAQQTEGPKAAPADMVAFQAELEALRVKHGVQADVKIKPVKADKTMQNGVVRPGADTLCGKIWATADAISLTTHTICAVAALKEHKDMVDINLHTIKTQYAKWRAFNGVKGRLQKLHAVHQVEGEYDGMKPIE